MINENKVLIMNEDVESLIKNTNNAIKSNKCNICDKTFSSANTLKDHLKTHSGEKPNKCNQCGYASSYASALRTHTHHRHCDHHHQVHRSRSFSSRPLQRAHPDHLPGSRRYKGDHRSLSKWQYFSKNLGQLWKTLQHLTKCCINLCNMHDNVCFPPNLKTYRCLVYSGPQ